MALPRAATTKLKFLSEMLMVTAVLTDLETVFYIFSPTKTPRRKGKRLPLRYAPFQPIAFSLSLIGTLFDFIYLFPPQLLTKSQNKNGREINPAVFII